MKKRLIIILLCLFLIAGFLTGYFFAKSISVKDDINDENNFHYLPITQSDYYDGFFDANVDCQDNYDEPIKGLLVNHHLLAGKFIAQALCQVATDKKITIVLLSPNHFAHGDGHIISSAFAWQTPYGILRPDQPLIAGLSRSKITRVDETPFEFEHGIYNLIPFIKKTMPNAEIVPIIVKDAVSREEQGNLISFLHDNLPADSLLIASLDFSHYLTSAEANKADEQTLKIISELNIDGIKNLNPESRPDNVDSKAVLEIFLSVMKQRQAVDFKLTAHSNSAQLIGDLDLPETTSYIVGLFLKK